MLVVASLGIAGGLSLGFEIFHITSPAHGALSDLNGSSFNTEAIAWSAPQLKIACPGGTLTQQPLLYDSFGGVTFNITQRGMGCEVIQNGSFVFAIQVIEPRLSPKAGYIEMVWQGLFGFSDRGKNWSDLSWITPNGLFGVEFTPGSSQALPWTSSAPGLCSYSFSLLVNTTYVGVSP